jgi:GNAT superfamily N-acetyltransferase
VRIDRLTLLIPAFVRADDGGGRDTGDDGGVTIEPARREHLPAAAALLAAGLGFAPADAVPAWLMQTTDDCGGVSLVAVDDGQVVGALHSIPGHDGNERYLFTCGLVVAATHRGRRLGLALTAEQRRRARLAGCRSIRWTADPVNGRALRLYLSGLGARLVGYRPSLHDGLRAGAGHPQDDVDLVWPIVDPPPPTAGNGTAEVELPWSQPTPADRDRVRERMTALLDGGRVGVDVRLDWRARRCWIVFAPPCRTPTS